MKRSLERQETLETAALWPYDLLSIESPHQYLRAFSIIFQGGLYLTTLPYQET